MNIFNNNGQSNINWNGVSLTLKGSHSISMTDTSISIDGKSYNLDEFKALAEGKTPSGKNTEPKYEIENGHIVALRDIPRHKIKKGDIGGIVDGYHNLTQKDDCWLAYGSRVSGDMVILGSGLHTGLVAKGNGIVNTSSNTRQVTVEDSVLMGSGSFVDLELKEGSRIDSSGNLESVKLRRSTIQGSGDIINSELNQSQVQGSGDVTSSVLNFSILQGSGDVEDSELKQVTSMGSGDIINSHINGPMNIMGSNDIVNMYN